MTSTSARRRLLVMWAGASLLLSACAPTYDWRELRPEGTALQLLFPCRPSTAQRRVPLAGASVTLTLYSCQAGEVTWGLSHADVDEPARVGEALTALQSAAASNIGAGQARSASTLAIAGATPQPRSGRLRLVGRLPDGKPASMEIAVFAKGTRVFQASAVREAIADGAGSGEAIETFLGSIRLAP